MLTAQFCTEWGGLHSSTQFQSVRGHVCRLICKLQAPCFPRPLPLFLECMFHTPFPQWELFARMQPGESSVLLRQNMGLSPVKISIQTCKILADECRDLLSSAPKTSLLCKIPCSLKAATCQSGVLPLPSIFLCPLWPGPVPNFTLSRLQINTVAMFRPIL